MMKLILLIIIVFGVSFSQDEEKKEKNPCVDPVSYTHLTLPTSDLV